MAEAASGLQGALRSFSVSPLTRLELAHRVSDYVGQILLTNASSIFYITTSKVAAFSCVARVA